jgi:secreted trypsin-like serine protease
MQLMMTPKIAGAAPVQTPSRRTERTAQRSQQPALVGPMSVPSPRVVGGAATAPSAYKFIASLQYWSQHICGATIINRDWVMTAAHCVIYDDGSPVYAPFLSLRVYEHDLTDAIDPNYACSGIVDVAEVVSHPDFNAITLDNDIALLRLASPRPPKCLASLPSLDIRPSIATPGTMATVAGWGRTSPEGSYPETYPNVMHEVAVPILSRKECAQAYGYLPSVMVCAGLLEGGKDSCQGDSGGPLFIKADGSPVVVGIVSWGMGCASEGYPGVYTRVSEFKSWLASILEPPPPPPSPPITCATLLATGTNLQATGEWCTDRFEQTCGTLNYVPVSGTFKQCRFQAGECLTKYGKLTCPITITCETLLATGTNLQATGSWCNDLTEQTCGTLNYVPVSGTFQQCGFQAGQCLAKYGELVCPIPVACETLLATGTNLQATGTWCDNLTKQTCGTMNYVPVSGTFMQCGFQAGQCLAKYGDLVCPIPN